MITLSSKIMVNFLFITSIAWVILQWEYILQLNFFFSSLLPPQKKNHK